MSRYEFLHYFHGYHDSHQEDTYFVRFPKRLNSPLCDPHSSEDHGWGVYIIEGPNRVVLTWCCVVILVLSFVISITYSVVMKTQEQGFGIGQWMVAVLTAVLAALYFQWEEN
ncbi:hypothetical protein EJ04DRAFT_258658 [Polyplosphaeria fusca]|uniref:Uncharacterized protein n=1 Tax=Polyplosphaeria fusca TaxID=682080 RepID=A0A9P4QWD6_9PLEO|nr:hypothetical protein EJ04DRAFT_258658 [Polyplosphaeria fusca]